MNDWREPRSASQIDLTDIWSGGCNTQLHYALPVLFFWELFGLITSGLGTFRHCHYATLAEEAQDKLFRERVKAAIDLGKETAQKVAPVASAGENLTSPSTDEGTGNVADSEEDRNEPAHVRKKAKRQGRRELRRLSTTVSFGPSFGLPFTQQDSADSA
ncbi:hypothetical protein EDB81DRAFT_635018 [Dactylonectria macrodidyma]|uniref:Uncharacterized protein n=1 Tax=Dactylonectria macrodidyma TaxID=307937 RepID=A0A9P9FT23_9HYPO|nr:hypothetical protein EDB81DRAFT_635018 [Dactylonectria macrodidyma]